MNNVPCLFERRAHVIRTVLEEGAALLSIALFIGMIALWAGALSSGL
jgi:hypothetical protein